MGVYETKLRTLYVMRILAENTDQDHILNATDICKLWSNSIKFTPIGERFTEK